MARIVAGIGLSHVPSVGVAYDRGKQQEPAWKPLFDAYVPVREWLGRLEPDIAIVVYNDHGADFMFDKYPTFAIGAADGLPAEILQRAERTWSLGPLTLPHELARVVVYEQLYRAYTIRRGEKYHRGS